MIDINYKQPDNYIELVGEPEEFHASIIKGGKQRSYTRFNHPIPHIITPHKAPSLRGWYKDKHEPEGRRARPCYSEAFLTRPYGGFCPTYCVFCYVNYGVRGYRLTHTTVVDPYYPEKVAKDLEKLQTGTIAYISSFTEPFCPLEPIYHVTERLSEAITRVGLPLFYLTRQIIPDWAITYVKQNPYSYVQYSINTPNEDVWRKLSPRAAKLEDMFLQIMRISREGVYVGLQVNPVIPGIISLEELERLVEMGIHSGVKHFIFKFVEQDIGNYKEFIKQLKLRFAQYPDRLRDFEYAFGESIGSQISIKYLLRRKWLEYLHTKFITDWKDKATMSLCYEYKPDPSNSAGVSLAPEFTTAHQCHGKRVPIFVRNGARFEPFEECYGNCLYCEDMGKVACKGDVLKQARALEWTDWTKISIR